MPTEQSQFKKEIFHWKKVLYGTTIILLMYRSAMLHKCKQNITFNTYKKEKSMKKNGWVIFPREGGSIFYYSILPPRHFSTRVNILSDTGTTSTPIDLVIVSYVHSGT